MAAKYAMACFAANENDDENDNFHMEVNCQFSIVHCQLSKFVPTSEMQVYLRFLSECSRTKNEVYFRTQNSKFRIQTASLRRDQPPPQYGYHRPRGAPRAACPWHRRYFPRHLLPYRGGSATILPGTHRAVLSPLPSRKNSVRVLSPDTDTFPHTPSRIYRVPEDLTPSISPTLPFG